MTLPRLNNSAALKAALASGLSAEDVNIEADTPDNDDEAPAVDLDAGTPDSGDILVDEPELAVETDKPNPKPESEPTHLASLTAELRDVIRDNAKLQAQVEDLTSRLERSEAGNATARDIVRTATNRLAVTLNTTLMTDDDASLETWCTTFLKVNRDFERRFPALSRSRAVSAPQPEMSAAEQAELNRRLNSARKIGSR